MSLSLDEVINWKTFKNSCNGRRAEKEGCIVVRALSIGKYIGIISKTLSYKMCSIPTFLIPTFHSLIMLIDSLYCSTYHPCTVVNNTVGLRYLSSQKPKEINL